MIPRALVKAVLYALAEMRHGPRARQWGIYVNRNGLEVLP